MATNYSVENIIKNSTVLSDESINQLVNDAKAKATSYSTEEKTKLLNKAVGFIDLTSLEATDTTDRIQNLAKRAYNQADFKEVSARTAAICVYPNWVECARQQLDSSYTDGYKVQLASVATAFPSGNTSLEVKIAEVKYAVAAGADEIDMVISRGQFLMGNYQFVYDEIKAIKEACGTARLKVILETGELKTTQNIRIASDLAMHAGADFIKTSTGKIPVAATLEAAAIMLDAIKAFKAETGTTVGFKPAGGIRSALDALEYISLVDAIVGAEWLEAKWFRFGASSLLDNVLAELKLLKTGESTHLDNAGAY